MHVYFSQQESKALVECGAKVIGKRARIIVQTSALLVDEIMECTHHAADCGADGVMVLPRFFEGPTDDDGVFKFYAAVVRGGLLIIGYNVPQVVGVELTPSLLRRLNEIPEFLAVKDSSGDLAKQAALIRTGLPMMNGADALVPYAMYAGVKGLIWGDANFAPKTCTQFVTAAQEYRWDDARDLASARTCHVADLGGRLRAVRVCGRRHDGLRSGLPAPAACASVRKEDRRDAWRARRVDRTRTVSGITSSSAPSCS